MLLLRQLLSEIKIGSLIIVFRRILGIPEMRLDAINLAKQFRRNYHINVKSIMDELPHECSNCLDSKTQKGIRELADIRIHHFHYCMFLQWKIELSKHILCYLIKGMYTFTDNSLDSEQKTHLCSHAYSQETATILSRK